MISTARTTGTRRRIGRVAPLAALVGVALVLSGCLSSGYTYLQHSNPDKTVVYFKLPSTWPRATYAQDLKEKNAGLTATQVQQLASGTGIEWFVGFTASKRYKPSLDYNPSAYQPQGIALVQQIPPGDSDTFSLSLLRAQIIGQDPLELQQPNGTKPPFIPISASEFTTPTGIRGTRLVTYITETKGIRDEFAQIAEVDPQTNLMFILAVGCRASCYGANAGTIKQVLNAWNVKELVHA